MKTYHKVHNIIGHEAVDIKQTFVSCPVCRQQYLLCTDVLVRVHVQGIICSLLDVADRFCRFMPADVPKSFDKVTNDISQNGRGNMFVSFCYLFTRLYYNWLCCSHILYMRRYHLVLNLFCVPLSFFVDDHYPS